MSSGKGRWGGSFGNLVLLLLERVVLYKVKSLCLKTASCPLMEPEFWVSSLSWFLFLLAVIGKWEERGSCLCWVEWKHNRRWILSLGPCCLEGTNCWPEAVTFLFLVQRVFSRSSVVILLNASSLLFDFLDFISE